MITQDNMEVVEFERGAGWVMELCYCATHLGTPCVQWDKPSIAWQYQAYYQWVVRVTELGCTRELYRWTNEGTARHRYAELRDAYMVRDSAPIPQEDV